ncbi:MAG: hypothetical protein KIS94_00805 [Chitinophagales bacterium]|nr:hypothetical protein [Chitinophagales bacterium]
MAPADNIFSASTTARLDAIQPQLATAINLVRSKKAVSIEKTLTKNEAGAGLRKFCSHYLQVFNLAVERQKYPTSARAFFGLNTDTGKLPDMVTDADAEQVGKNIALGEAELLAHSLPAMANPSAAEVATLLTAFMAARTNHSNAAQELDAAEEAVDALEPEADKVIKKIYDEAEAHYNEEEPDSQRADCRWWGVLYISVGNDTQLTVLVKDGSGTPLQGKAVKLVQAAGKVLITGADGRVVFNTKVIGEATLEIYLDPEHLTDPDLIRNITIEEGEPQTVEVVV